MNIPISYHWLRVHFEKDIPVPNEIATLLTKHLCEVEGMEVRGDDTIFDFKILPDRGHDLLSHYGIAREVSILSGVPFKKIPTEHQQSSEKTETNLKVTVLDPNLCPRYMGRVIENVGVGESSAWLRARLESVGQRSINNIVDITNFVMLELGQPMHAFDLRKLSGAEIFVRKAHEGEKMMTLDNKDIVLTPETLVIADSKQVLAIAGVKGGKDAGVESGTTSIVFESANFNAVSTRKTSQRVGIRTDSSRRYEHGLSPSLTEEAMHLATKLLLEMYPQARVGEIVDVYPEPQQTQTVTFTTPFINSILGTTLTPDEVKGIIMRLGFACTQEGETFTITPPLLRLDLTIKEDLAEEIGRVYGLSNIIDTPLPDFSFTARPLKSYYYANLIRDTLVVRGFSEVYTSSFQKEGEFAVLNPLAEDKAFLRKNLAMNIEQALDLNARNAPLLGLDEIKIFEIGKVFPRVMEEKLVCAVGIELTTAGKKKDTMTREALEEIRMKFGEVLGVSVEGTFTTNIFEFDLGALLDTLPEPNVGVPFTSIATRYEKISVYPFMLRDIALWVPEGISSDEVLAIIVHEGGDLLRTKRLFDVFTKEFPEGKRTSYAFNLVFQSYEKTLSDEEINNTMLRITIALRAHGWEVR